MATRVGLFLKIPTRPLNSAIPIFGQKSYITITIILLKNTTNVCK